MHKTRQRLRVTASFILLPALILSLAAGSRAQGDEGEVPATLEELRRQKIEEIEGEVAHLPDLGTFTIEQVVQFTLDNDDLDVRTELPQTTGHARIEIEGLPGYARVNIRGGENGQDAVSRIFQLWHDDVNQPGKVNVRTEVSAMVGRVTLARVVETLAEDRTVQYIQSWHHAGDPEEDVKLYVQGASRIADTPTIDLNLSAPNLIELRRRWPRETVEHLQPLFRTFAQDAAIFAVDPRLAWQVFADAHEPDAGIVAKVDEILARFEAESFQQRQAAARDLDELGQPAALYLMKRDRSDLSPEQNSRVDEFLDDYQPLDADEADRLRDSPDFLLDCLYSDDRDIRAQGLGRLEAQLGREIDFDLDADPDQRAQAISQLREQLEPEQ